MSDVQKIKIIQAYGSVSAREEKFRCVGYQRACLMQNKCVCLDLDQYSILKWLIQRCECVLVKEDGVLRVKCVPTDGIEKNFCRDSKKDEKILRLFPFFKDAQDIDVQYTDNVLGVFNALKLMPCISLYNQIKTINNRKNAIVDLCRYPACSVELQKLFFYLFICYMISGFDKTEAVKEEIGSDLANMLRSLYNELKSGITEIEKKELYDESMKYAETLKRYSETYYKFMDELLDIEQTDTAWDHKVDKKIKKELFTLFLWSKKLSGLTGIAYEVPEDFESIFDIEPEEMKDEIKDIDEQIQNWKWEEKDNTEKEVLLKQIKCSLEKYQCISVNVERLKM